VCPYEKGTQNYNDWMACRYGKHSDQQPKPERSCVAKVAGALFQQRCLRGKNDK